MAYGYTVEIGCVGCMPDSYEAFDTYKEACAWASDLADGKDGWVIETGRTAKGGRWKVYARAGGVYRIVVQRVPMREAREIQGVTL